MTEGHVVGALQWGQQSPDGAHFNDSAMVVIPDGKCFRFIAVRDFGDPYATRPAGLDELTAKFQAANDGDIIFMSFAEARLREAFDAAEGLARHEVPAG